MDIRLRFLTAEIAILTAVASLFATNTEEWTKVYERRLFCEMQMNLWRGGYEQKTGEEAGIPGMEAVWETMVEEEVPRSPLAAEAESYSQPLAQNAESEAVNEQTAEEKGLEESDIVPEEVERVRQAVVPGQAEDVHQETPVASDQQSYVCSVSCDGDCLDAGVSEYLKRRLTEAGIGWFFPYACCIAYQESSFNPLAVNPNGRDFGLYQFRIEFHPGFDWQNPYAQVDLFTAMMANRAAAGCDVYTMISRHLMSDYGPYNQSYVDLVLSHLPKLQGVWN